jgi:mannose-6-phosphate isomerase-like protein (cupin superfamily)
MEFQNVSHQITSFGQRHPFLFEQQKIRAEYLEFHFSGRPHLHEDLTEHFYVLEGKGEIFCGDQASVLKAGDLFVIPAQTSHWMRPTEGTLIKALIWYSQQKLNVTDFNQFEKCSSQKQ